MCEFFYGDMDEKEWDELCDNILRLRYKDDGYQSLVLNVNDDYGIKAFTDTGIVFQYYYPTYSSVEEFNKYLEKKIDSDIDLLLKNATKLTLLGIKHIIELHFIIPLYKDNKILEFCMKKRNELLEAKHTNELGFIDDHVKVLIKIEKDFRKEISELIFKKQKYKLDTTIRRSGDINWKECPAEKVQNIKRKLNAIMPNKGDSTWQNRQDRLLETYVSYYLRGMEIMRYFKSEFPDLYENVLSLEQTCRKHVQIKCDLHEDSAINKQIFQEILSDFNEKIASEFKELSSTSISELCHELVSGWLADCSMDFR